MLEKLPRALRWVAAFIGGVLIAAVTTPLSQSTLVLWGISLPWGLVLALATVAAYILGLRLASGGRTAPVCAAVGVIATVSLLSLEGPGGGVILPGNLIGTVWAAGPAVICVLLIAFPALKRR